MRSFHVFLIQALFLLPAALPAQEAAIPGPVKKIVAAACFEVVVKRADESKNPITYEKELPWDLVPFNIRNDKYFSIGTAFAISKDELVTAHHVFQPLHASKSYQTCYIRDAKQNVYEVDQILALDEQRDVARFTVKGRTFDSWIALNPAFENDQTVFTVGNAYGEGVVIRPGEIIGTVPEPLNGAWNLLKSSAGVNPGNSGGPLVDAAGRAVGVVLAKKDNICYSLPAAELQKMKPHAAVFYNKATFSFSLFPEQTKALDRAFEIALPKPYGEVRKAFSGLYADFYAKAMNGLFESLGDELFPGGSSSEEAINAIPTSTDPEVIFRDKATKVWSYSGLEYKSADLGKNGRLRYAGASGVYFFKLQRPEDVPLRSLAENSKLAMDLLLKGIPVQRTVAGQEIRITSFGAPYMEISHQDRFGRPWRKSLWHTPYDDGIVLSYATVVPSGLVMAVKFIESAQLMEWEYDLAKMLDYAYIPYVGKLSHWSEFLQLGAALPAPLRAMKLDFEAGKRLKVEAFWARLALDPKSMELSPGSYVGLYMGFSRRGKEVVWNLRRIVFDCEEDDNYFVVLKHQRPEAGLPEDVQKAWKEVAKQRHPYTEKAFEEDGSTRIAALLSGLMPKGVPAMDQESLYTLYMVRVGKVGDAEMHDRMKRLMASISLADPAQPSDPVLRAASSRP